MEEAVMRRGLTLALAVLALLGVLAPPSFAQAPAPKVTVNGLIDTITTAAKNIDANFSDARDSGWWARNRGVFTITGEVGKAKGVLALEIDLGWGQVSSNESVVSNSGQTISSSAGAFGSQQNGFHQGAFDLGNDVGGVIEIKNLYVEFPMPLMPIPTVVRLGGQPFQTTFKPAVVATTDYGGVWLETTITPNIKFNATYAQAEEDLQGMRVQNNFFRGDDFFVMPSFTITPIKGLDVRPFVGYYSIYGNSHNQSRCRVQCAGVPSNGTMAAVNQFTGAVTTASLGNYRQNSQEHRWYFGIDTRFTAGPFYLDPTFVWEHSRVDVYRDQGGTTLAAGLTQGVGQRVRQKTDSWLADVRGGMRVGPLLIELMAMWTPGDDAQHDSFKNTRLYHPVNVDIGYGASWTEILSLGSVDYFTNAGHGMGENIGLGRYGRRQIGTRLTYSVTPAFDVNFKAAAAWTDTKVDTDAPTTLTGASFGAVPCALGSLAACAGTNQRGDHRFIGVEADGGITYRFAPGLTFDAVYGHLFAGDALKSTFTNPAGTLRTNIDAKDADVFAARVRYQF
jgi:hypothetical protein